VEYNRRKEPRHFELSADQSGPGPPFLCLFLQRLTKHLLSRWLKIGVILMWLDPVLVMISCVPYDSICVLVSIVGIRHRYR
jgi:hypothetical protein